MKFVSTDPAAAVSLSMCKTLFRASDFAGARKEVDWAMATWPNEAGFPWLSAQLFARENKGAEAFVAVQRAMDLAPAPLAYWQSFCLALPENLSHETPGLLDKIARAMALDGVANAPALKAAQQIVDRVFAPQLNSPSTASVAAMVADNPHHIGLLGAFLEYGRTTAPTLEDALTRLRRCFLDAIRDPAIVEFADLVAALAIHCFNNEFVFAESAEEQAAVASVQQRLHGQADLLSALVLGAYRPIMNEPYADALLAQAPALGEGAVARALRVLIAEPWRERELARTVVRATPINDKVSDEVRLQYEQNPYPRWQHLGGGLLASPPAPSPPQRILIAGCGTGKQPLLAARNAPHDTFWAMDLSLASLGYAMRKAEDLGITNVKFLHGDILELGSLDMKFDAIACGGVLHHMAVPEKGLPALRTKLTDNAVLKIMMYTESGRRAVVAGIALRQELGLDGSPDGIRRFRAVVRDLPPEHPAAGLRNTLDFYSASECRDLVFHVMEHRYTLPLLADMFARAGFRLVKVVASAHAVACFRKMFPDPALDPKLNLDLWAQVEDRYPGLFGSMYGLNVMKA